jgi:hypothetical protein
MRQDHSDFKNKNDLAKPRDREQATAVAVSAFGNT